MRHILGIVGSKAYNISTREEDYMIKQYVSQDIIDWLNNHDIKIDDRGRKIYVCNQVEYIYLGVQPKTPVINISKLLE